MEIISNFLTNITPLSIFLILLSIIFFKLKPLFTKTKQSLESKTKNEAPNPNKFLINTTKTTTNPYNNPSPSISILTYNILAQKFMKRNYRKDLNLNSRMNKELSSNNQSNLTHEISLDLLKSSMDESGYDKFILEGFHRKFDEFDLK